MIQPNVLNMQTGTGYALALTAASTLVALLRTGEAWIQPVTGALPAAPVATPAPVAGATAKWSHLLPGDKRNYGLEGLNAPAGGDQITGLLVWCITAGELEFNAH